MLDVEWCEITIGGSITKEIWVMLQGAIHRDTGRKFMGSLPGEHKPTINHLVFEEHLPNGEFSKIEDLCLRYGVPYRRQSLGSDPELLVFTPTNKENHSHSYSLNVDSDIMTQAEELMELRSAMKEITLQNAPMFVNDNRLLYEKYAKCLLAGIDFQTMMISILDDYLPPSIPELPPFRVGE